MEGGEVVDSHVNVRGKLSGPLVRSWRDLRVSLCWSRRALYSRVFGRGGEESELLARRSDWTFSV